MSILIKGMDMPESCYECAYSIERVGICSITQGGCEWGHNRPPNCPLIEIPTPHGRLIDADKIKEKRETMCWKDEFYMTHESDFIDSRYIANAPTIVEAEE